MNATSISIRSVDYRSSDRYKRIPVNEKSLKPRIAILRQTVYLTILPRDLQHHIMDQSCGERSLPERKSCHRRCLHIMRSCLGNLQDPTHSVAVFPCFMQVHACFNEGSTAGSISRLPRNDDHRAPHAYQEIPLAFPSLATGCRRRTASNILHCLSGMKAGIAHAVWLFKTYHTY